MKNTINEINQNQLWNGCILASIAHAIMVGEYPEFTSEHSWDGMNYNIQNSSGCRGTITFAKNMLVAVFQDNEIINIDNYNEDSTLKYFEEASKEIVKLAEEEALQYVIDEINGKTISVISTAFWEENNEIYSNDNYDNMIKNGGYLIKNQIQPIEEAIKSWVDYYDMSDSQIELMKLLYGKKILEPNNDIILNDDEKSILINSCGEDIEECIESFGEINIYF